QISCCLPVSTLASRFDYERVFARSVESPPDDVKPNRSRHNRASPVCQPTGSAFDDEGPAEPGRACAGEGLNLHGLKRPLGPQPSASTNSATSACGARSSVASCPVRDLCRNAVDAALGAGASYADARGVVKRSQSVATKNGNVEAVADVETEGIG